MLTIDTDVTEATITTAVGKAPVLRVDDGAIVNPWEDEELTLENIKGVING